MNSITGFATEALDPVMELMVSLFLYVSYIGLIILLIMIIFFVISIFKHTIPIIDVFNSAWHNFSKNYSLIVIYFIFSAILLSGMYIYDYSISSKSPALDTPVPLSVLSPYLICAMIVAIYCNLLNLSIIKSYYCAKNSGDFSFIWISLNQVITLIIALIILGLLSIFSLILLGIPSFFVTLYAFVVTFKIIVHDADLGSSLSSGWDLFKLQLWDIIFFSCTYLFGIVIYFLAVKTVTMPFGKILSLFIDKQFVPFFLDIVFIFISVLLITLFGFFFITEFFYRISPSEKTK